VDGDDRRDRRQGEADPAGHHPGGAPGRPDLGVPVQGRGDDDAAFRWRRPHSGLRGRIRDGIRVEDTINGADIKSTGQLARQYDAAGGWRHPVYGNDVWVTQEGTEYFITVIAAAGPEVGKPMILAALSAMFRF
jgi:hypothetical protein